MLDKLKQKWHGLPIWLWAVLVAVAIIIVYRVIKSRQSTSSANNNAGSASDLTTPTDNGSGFDTGGGSGFQEPAPVPGNNGQPQTVVNTQTPAPEGSNNQPGVVVSKTQTPTSSSSPTKPTGAGIASILVPAGATATSLQSTVAPVGPSGVLKPGTQRVIQEVNHPSAVKVTANKTGASANKAQGIFSIH